MKQNKKKLKRKTVTEVYQESHEIEVPTQIKQVRSLFLSNCSTLNINESEANVVERRWYRSGIYNFCIF